MALGLHWEWRGFGTVSSRFSDRFDRLASLFPPQDVKDVYLWVPGLEVNVKVRDIPEEPFKFKRLQDKDGHLERWAEDPRDIFGFPLDEAGWVTLAKTLATVNLALGPYPPGKVDAETTLARLKEIGARAVAVDKQRESRLWQGPNGKVKVERACIRSPQSILSIGLETWDESPEGEGLSDDCAQEDIRAAIRELGLDQEPLRPMNYLDAVAVWAEQRSIS